jgi:N-methylhydantoinase B/oxoprolinase/acetone carboxylase alpha subunit
MEYSKMRYSELKEGDKVTTWRNGGGGYTKEITRIGFTKKFKGTAFTNGEDYRAKAYEFLCKKGRRYVDKLPTGLIPYYIVVERQGVVIS